MQETDENVEVPDPTDDELIKKLIRDHPLQCAGCTKEIAFGEPFLRFEYVVGYSIETARKGYVALTRPYARYDNEWRYVHLTCINILPKQY